MEKASEKDKIQKTDDPKDDSGAILQLTSMFSTVMNSIMKGSNTTKDNQIHDDNHDTNADSKNHGKYADSNNHDSKAKTGDDKEEAKKEDKKNGEQADQYVTDLIGKMEKMKIE